MDESKKTAQLKLAHLTDLWDDVQMTRRRDAIYRYLTGIYRIVQQWGAISQLNKKARQALRERGLRVGKGDDLFAAVIRATADGDGADRKAISKWSRVLRYAARYKGAESLKAFITRKGGINGCAARFSVRLGRQA
jgi:hypothetical protein